MSDFGIAMTNEDGTLRTLAQGGRMPLPRPSAPIFDSQDQKLWRCHTGYEVYTPYGNNANGAPIAGQPYRYTGRRLDAQTGLYYYRARYYDPAQGRSLPWPFPSQIVSQERFVGSAYRLQSLQTDPIGYEDQMNLYNYVDNDPVNGVDPSGKAAFTVGVDVEGSVAGAGIGVQAKLAVSVSRVPGTKFGLEFKMVL